VCLSSTLEPNIAHDVMTRLTHRRLLLVWVVILVVSELSSETRRAELITMKSLGEGGLYAS
jgi:hypothetical protein